MMKPKLLVSFSGGKTSAYMSYMLKRDYSYKYDLYFVFANTGQEHEKTLEFVDRCDREFELGVVWVEAVTHEGERKGCTDKIVSFETASRNGEPFEEVIKKYGIPNKAYPHCNRELKINPIHTWAKRELGEYITAIGIRCDEHQRVSDKAPEAHSLGIVYPLVEWEPKDKIDVNDFWEEQSFELGIPEHYGNCKTCWKKSDRKLFTILSEHYDWFDFFSRMEAEYGLSGHNIDGTHRVFFRSNRSTEQLKAEWETSDFVRFAEDPMKQQKLFGYDLDASGGCSEECHAY